MRLPLSGILVADFSRILAGPLCTMMLADAGARVIKIEEPGRGDETRRWGPPFVGEESAYFLSINRGKESITLNLKTAAGRRIAKELIRRADVVVDNFLREQKEKLGLTASAVRQTNPRVVHCSITGYDSESAEAELPGYDLLAQAGGGLMSITGDPEGEPTKVGVAVADVLTAHYAYGAICSALYARQKSGSGESIEVSLFGAAVASLINVAQAHLVTGKEVKRYGNAHPSIVPYQTFHGSDRLFAVAVATDRHFEILCHNILDRPTWPGDRLFRTNAARVKNRRTLIARMEEIFRQRKAAVWVGRCQKVGIPAAIARRVSEVFRDPGNQPTIVRHATIGDLPTVPSPIRLSGKRLPVRSAPPTLGADTRRILRQLGHTAAEIERLRRDGVI